jgi:O-antigen/teichoic acid export membrane protein
MSGTAFGQLLNLAAYPFLTRTYTPQDFGLYTVFVSAVSTLGAVTCGRFDVAVQVARHADSFITYSLSQIINSAVSLLTALVLLAHWWLVGGDFTPTLVALLGLTVFLLGHTTASSAMLIKGERYKLNSAGLITRTLLTSGPQIGLYYLWPNQFGLSVGFCLGLAAQALLFRLSTPRGFRPRVTLVRLHYVFKRYRRYLLDVPNQLLAALALNALSFVLLDLFTAKDVGFYSLAFRLCALPLSIFSSSLSQVYFQKAAKAHRAGGTFWKELRFNLLTSSALAAVVFTALVLLARPLARLYLGQEWEQSGEIMIVLAPMLALRFVSVSIATTALVVGKLHWLLCNNLALFASVALPGLLAKLQPMPLEDFLVIHVVLGSITHVAFISFLVSQTRRNHARPPMQVASTS